LTINDTICNQKHTIIFTKFISKPMVFETFHYTQQTQLLAEKAQVLPLAQVAAEQHWTDNQYIVTSMFDVPDMGDPKCKDNEHPVVHQPQHQGEVPYSTCEPDTNGNGSKTDCLAIPFL
jgi:hypothetical protein